MLCVGENKKLKFENHGIWREFALFALLYYSLSMLAT